MSFDLDYILIYLFLLLVFYLTGKQVSKGKNYWANAFLCIIVYTIILGSRYGRGNDYFSYIAGYLQTNPYENSGYLFIKSVMKAFYIDKFHIFYVYAFITIVGGMFFLERYRKYATFMFPTFLLATFILAEYQVRQSLSYSFVFLYLIQLFQIRSNKIKDIFSRKNYFHLLWGIIFAGITVSIHTANALNIVILTGLYLFVRFPVPYNFSIPMIVISSYIIPRIYDVGMIIPILQLLGEQDDFFARYVDTQEQWFGSDALSTEVAENPIVKVIEVLGNISLLYFGRKVIMVKMNNQESVTMYNFFFIGTCIVLAFKLMEIAARVGSNMRLFWFYPLAVVLYYRKIIVSNKWESRLFFFLVFWVYAFLKFLFMNGDMTLFLWDKM